MKKGICYLLLLCFCVSMLSGCGVKKEYTYPHDQTLRLDASKEEVVSKCDLKAAELGNYSAHDIWFAGYQCILYCGFDDGGRLTSLYYFPNPREDSYEDVYDAFEAALQGIYGEGNICDEYSTEKAREWYVTLPEKKLFRIYLTKGESVSLHIDRFLPDGTKYKPKYNKLPE